MYDHSRITNLYFPRRIAEAMNKIFDFPLTVVEAPMGYGKTTAVRSILEILMQIFLCIRFMIVHSTVFGMDFAVCLMNWI
jgi:uncharacterized membrane protein YeiB